MGCRKRSAVRQWMVIIVVGALTVHGVAFSQPESVYDPPALGIEKLDLELLDAISLTLDNDPNLLTKREDISSQYGRYQEASGAFDWNLGGQLQYEYRIQELTESGKQGEIDRRNQLEDAGVVACDLEDLFTRRLAELDQALAGGSWEDLTTDAGFQAQIRIIDSLIENATNGAQARALEETRRNLLQTERNATADALTLAATGCQDAADSLARIGEAPLEEEFDIGRVDFNLRHQSRRGPSWTWYLKGSTNDSQYPGKRDGFFEPSTNPIDGQPLFTPSGIPLERLVDFGGKNQEDFFSIDVGFDVNIPLMRNSGREAAGASERSAEIDWIASEFMYRHTATESVLNTIFAYWNLVGAQERVAISESSAALQADVLEITRALIDAEELPGIEEARALASDASARSQLEAARRDLLKAQLDLITSMGLSANGEELGLTARTGFVAPPMGEGLDGLEDALIREAMANRHDLEALRQLTESGKILARAATINLKPRFDLSLGAFASARGEGSLSEATDRWTGPSWKLGTNIEKPIGNNAAKGQMLQAEAQMRRREISEADLERRVNIAIVRNLNSLVKALEELAYAEQAAGSFEETFAAELEKLKLGETTVLDTTITEQQRARSALALVSARVQVATLIAVLRFETGTLAIEDGDGSKITFRSLTGFPRPGAQS